MQEQRVACQHPAEGKEGARACPWPWEQAALSLGRMGLAAAHGEVQLCRTFPVHWGLGALTDLFLPLRKTQSIVKSEFQAGPFHITCFSKHFNCLFEAWYCFLWSSSVSFSAFTADQTSQLQCLLRGHPEVCGARAELRAPSQLSCTELAQLAQAQDAAYLPTEKPPMDNGKWLQQWNVLQNSYWLQGSQPAEITLYLHQGSNLGQ